VLKLLKTIPSDEQLYDGQKSEAAAASPKPKRSERQPA
jgi:hypothetical protein